MASESVTESQGTKRQARCKHDVEMVNAVNERLTKAMALLDLLMTTDDGQLLRQTVSNAAWIAFDLVEQAKELVNEKAPEMLS